MTFKEYVDALGGELGVEIETDGEACAFALGGDEGRDIDVVLLGFDERGMLLSCADLGEPPSGQRERLYRAMLEANDLFGDTAGATISINRATGRVRLQRYDDVDALANIGPAKALVAFAETAARWQRLVSDFREADASRPPADAQEQLPPTGSMVV